MLKTFASDNNAGVHPRIMEAMLRVNQGQVTSYGDDPYCQEAVALFREHFGPKVEIFSVFTGTAANILALQAISSSYQAIICAETAHIHISECGAPEKFTGSKLLTVPSTDGKITVEQIKPLLEVVGNQHNSQPRVVSITQATEFGTVYTPEEIQMLTAWAHSHGLYVHMDGARLANAAVSLNCSLREVTGDAGIDVLSFGGTKNGMMFGEAVVFFRPELAQNFPYIRKQGMQLMSKMRYAAAQFIAILSDDLWKQNALRANELARMLATELEQFPDIRITQKVETNGVFAVIPPRYLERLREKFYFYLWNEATHEVRLMTSFETTEDEIREFINTLKEVAQS